MAVLKYKDGSIWTSLTLGISRSDLLDEYPIGSFYISPISLYLIGGSNSDSNTVYSYNLTDASSPASMFGGTWTEWVLEGVNNTKINSSGFLMDIFTTGTTTSNGFSVFWEQNSAFKQAWMQQLGWNNVTTLIPYISKKPSYAAGSYYFVARVWERTA